MKRAATLSALTLVALGHVFAHDTEGPLDFTERPGGLVPADLVFRDETGNTARIGDLMDKPTILVFEYFDCSDGCGLLLSNLADAAGALDITPGVDYRILSVSFDPEDTPVLAAQKKSLTLSVLGRPEAPADGWRFLSGDQASIHELTDAVGFHYRRTADGFDHPLGLVFVSPRLKVVRYIRGERFLPADLKLSILEAATGTIGPTISRIARFCFRVSPDGRGLVLDTLKVTGSATLLAAVSMLLILIVKGRKKHTGGSAA